MPDYYLRRYVFPDADTSPSDPGAGGPSQVSSRGGFAPPVDICETEEGYGLRMEIAGVEASSVDIEAAEDGRTITISGVREANPAAQRGRFLNLEIQYGQFARRIVLPECVDCESATAAYRDGFLVVELPKRLESRKRRVPISQGA